MGEGHTGEINALTLRLDELEERFNSHETEVLARHAATEAQLNSVQIQLKRHADTMMSLQVEIQAFRRELVGWRDKHSEEIRDLRRAIDELGVNLLAAVNALQPKAVANG